MRDITQKGVHQTCAVTIRYQSSGKQRTTRTIRFTRQQRGLNLHLERESPFMSPHFFHIQLAD